MDFLKRVDAFVLTQCGRFSHWLQEMTGLTNFFVAKMAFSVFCVGSVMGVANYWWPFMDFKTNVVYVVCYFSAALYGSTAIYCCNENEHRLYHAKLLYKLVRGNEDAVMNFRLFFLGWSLLMLISTPVLLGVTTWKGVLTAVFGYFFVWGLCIGEFFIVVTPLPPGISKIRQFINNFAASFKKPISLPR